MKMSCEYLGSCAFIETIEKDDPISADAVRMTYCDRDKYGCARYSLLQVLSPEDVPDHLWPNDEEEARDVIKFRMGAKEKVRMGRAE
jgi:hypothetical protein